MPFKANIHQAKALENLSIKYPSSKEEFIGDKVTMLIPVKHDTDNYYVFDRSHLRLEDTLRADGTPAKQSDYQLSTSSYTLARHSLRHFIDDEEIDNADAALDPMRDAQEDLQDKLLLRKEIEVANVIMTSTTWSNNVSTTAANQWTNDTTVSSPITAVHSAQAAFVRESLRRENVACSSGEVFREGKEHSEVVERVKYTQREITKDIFGTLLDLRNYQVSDAYYNPNAEGAAESMTSVWGDKFWLGFNDPSPGKRKVGAVGLFWKNGRSRPYQVKTYRQDELGGGFVELDCRFSCEAIATQAGYILLDVI